jgi:hypothetical protein
LCMAAKGHQPANHQQHYSFRSHLFSFVVFNIYKLFAVLQK